MTDRVQAVTDLIDSVLDGHERQGSPERAYTPLAPEGKCWRCQTGPAGDGASGVCDGCRSFLLEDTDTDPAEATTGYGAGPLPTVDEWLDPDRDWRAHMDLFAAGSNLLATPEALVALGNAAHPEPHELLTGLAGRDPWWRDIGPEPPVGAWADVSDRVVSAAVTRGPPWLAERGEIFWMNGRAVSCPVTFDGYGEVEVPLTGDLAVFLGGHLHGQSMAAPPTTRHTMPPDLEARYVAALRRHTEHTAAEAGEAFRSAFERIAAICDNTDTQEIAERIAAMIHP